MNPTTPYEKVMRIIEGHRRGHYDLQGSVNLLEMLWQQQSQDGRKDVENALLSVLSSEPLTASKPVGNISPTVLRVVIRAIASFGPTASLPSLVFARLAWNQPDLMEIWAQGVCRELAYSMFHHADRFSQATLDATKALCAAYTYQRAAQLVGSEFPPAVVDAAAELERTLEHIEFARFAAILREGQQQPPAQASELSNLLAASGLPKEIESAMEQADSYLQGHGPFDPKNAADLIRTCMDEAHRAVVAELEAITGQRYEGHDRDGPRRAYMRRLDFISEAEEEFFSSIYTLISREGTHRLLAPKETVLVMERTVRDYLLLLLRRLASRRSSQPGAP